MEKMTTMCEQMNFSREKKMETKDDQIEILEGKNVVLEINDQITIRAEESFNELKNMLQENIQIIAQRNKWEKMNKASDIGRKISKSITKM